MSRSFRKRSFLLRYARFRFRLLCLLTLALVVLGLTALGMPRRSRAAGTITGTVFQDFNANGVRDLTSTITNTGGGTVGVAVDRGVQGVAVSLFAANGTANTVTDANGNYSFDTTALALNGPYRVEFTLPTGFESGPRGTDSGSTVQFVPDPVAGGPFSLGINRYQDYCENNPLLATTCFLSGDQSDWTTFAAFATFPYASGAVTATNPGAAFNNPLTHDYISVASTIGTTYGMGWQRETRTIFVGAFMKRHTGFGPVGGENPGTIYRIPLTAAPPATVAPVVFTTLAAGGNPHPNVGFPPQPPPPQLDADPASFDAVGKIGLGDIDVSEDELTLYAINVFTKTLNSIALVGNPPAPGAASAVGVPVNLPGAAQGCTANDVRPFGLGVRNGLVYVGMVCTAESSANVDTFTDTNGNGRWDFCLNAACAAPEPFVDGDGNGIFNVHDARLLRAYVYTFNPAAGAFSGAPVLEFSLNYPRTFADDPLPVRWRPWTNDFNLGGAFHGFNIPGVTELSNAQPILSDIVFDNDQMVIVLRDRGGDQYGQQQGSTNPADTTLYLGAAGGDILRACFAGGVYTLETNGTCGAVTTGGAGTGQGIGNGEYYFQDSFTVNASDPHSETTVSGAVIVPGFPDVAVNAYDPVNYGAATGNGFHDGGARWYRHATGAYTKAYRLFNSDGGAPGQDPPDPFFGKSNGLGDLEALCDIAPIEVGNRIWNDANGNGVQDANEAPIAGVRVNLYSPGGVLLATAVTDANGLYTFSNDRALRQRTAGEVPTATGAVYGIAGLTANTTGYRIALDDAGNYGAGNPLDNLFATNPLLGGATQRDSDGVAPTPGVLVSLANVPTLTFNTGRPGQNVHTLDFGFTPTAPAGGGPGGGGPGGGGPGGGGAAGGTSGGVSGPVVQGPTAVNTGVPVTPAPVTPVAPDRLPETGFRGPRPQDAAIAALIFIAMIVGATLIVRRQRHR